MKTILTAALLLATALVAMPGATACEVSDPTGTTATCVNQYESSWGACDDGYGYDYHSTYGYSFVPGIGAAGVAVWDSCQADPWTGDETHGQGAAVFASESSTGLYVLVGHANYEGSYDSCSIYVQHNADGSWQTEQISC